MEKAIESKVFMFADTDLKVRPAADGDRFRPGQGGVAGGEPLASGRGPRNAAGRELCQPVQQQREKLQSHSGSETERAADSGSIEEFLRQRRGREAGAALDLRDPEDDGEPRTLNRFQQLNSAKIQGAIPPGVTQDQALKVLEEAAKDLPKGFTIDYGGSSRQLRVEGNKLMGTFVLSIILIFLVLAAQFESFRDPLIILLGSVPLALAGALLPAFLGIHHN